MAVYSGHIRHRTGCRPAYVASTTGQRAMAVAKLVPEATKYKRGGSNSPISANWNTTHQRVGKARFVLATLPNAAERS